MSLRQRFNHFSSDPGDLLAIEPCPTPRRSIHVVLHENEGLTRVPPTVSYLRSGSISRSIGDSIFVFPIADAIGCCREQRCALCALGLLLHHCLHKPQIFPQNVSVSSSHNVNPSSFVTQSSRSLISIILLLSEPYHNTLPLQTRPT